MLGIRIKSRGVFLFGVFLLFFFTRTLLWKQQLLVSFQLIRVMVCRTGLGWCRNLCHFNQAQVQGPHIPMETSLFGLAQAGGRRAPACFALALAKLSVRKLGSIV